jgi:cobalamin biosynthesis Mg chelatase CobN
MEEEEKERGTRRQRACINERERERERVIARERERERKRKRERERERARARARASERERASERASERERAIYSHMSTHIHTHIIHAPVTQPNIKYVYIYTPVIQRARRSSSGLRASPLSLMFLLYMIYAYCIGGGGYFNQPPNIVLNTQCGAGSALRRYL